MNEQQERLYIQGEAQALKQMIIQCQAKLAGLGVELKTDESFSQERVETVAVLRSLCDDYGDNNWTEDLHIADIVRKHLCVDMDNREAEETITLLRGALVGLVGSDDKAELEQMEVTVRAMYAPGEDKANTINAIYAIIKTQRDKSKDTNNGGS